MKVVAALLTLPLVALALPAETRNTIALEARGDVKAGDYCDRQCGPVTCDFSFTCGSDKQTIHECNMQTHKWEFYTKCGDGLQCHEGGGFCTIAPDYANLDQTITSAVGPPVAAPVAARAVVGEAAVKPGDKCKYNPLNTLDLYTCSADKKVIYECNSQTSTWAISASCQSSAHCEEGSGFCISNPASARSFRMEEMERVPIQPGDTCKYDHLSFDMYTCSPNKKVIYECSPQTNTWQISVTCPAHTHCIPRSGFCVSDGPHPSHQRDEQSGIQAVGIPYHDHHSIVKNPEPNVNNNIPSPAAEQTYTLPAPQPTVKPRSDNTNPITRSEAVHAGDECHYDSLNSFSFSRCGANGKDVFHCDLETGKWEFFWTCAGQSKCVDGSDFCVSDGTVPDGERAMWH